MTSNLIPLLAQYKGKMIIQLILHGWVVCQIVKITQRICYNVVSLC